MCRYADHIARTSVPAPARARLLRPSGDRAGAGQARPRDRRDEYLDLASYFIDERGSQPHYFDTEARARGSDPEDCVQAPTSTTSRTSRCASRTRWSAMPCGPCICIPPWPISPPRMATPDLGRLRAAVAGPDAKRLYVTGGLGPSLDNEGFTSDYDLPNETAYAETCAAVGLVFWAHRMLRMTGDAQLADVMERALYNGAITGLSLRRRRFFYENPLESRGGISAGSGIAAHAVRPISPGWSHRSVSMSLRSRRASCRCISTARAGSPPRSMGTMSNCVRRRDSHGMAMSRSRSAQLGRHISRCGCAFRIGAPRSASW